MMNYPVDKAERFSSDTHRRVLGHLSLPEDTYGWSVPALVNRMVPDVASNITSLEEMVAVLEELESDGHAQRIATDTGDVWRMTQDGFDVLTGPIKNEPPPGAAVQGPAIIGSAGAATSLEPTQLGEENAADTPA